jgi:WD40 repeat protein
MSDMAFGSLFNDDIFISYSRNDGGDYVLGLDNELTKKGYSCFTDNKGTDAGKELPADLYRRIRASKMLIFLGTPGAVARPEYVAREVAEFSNANGTLRIVPISFDKGEEEIAKWERTIWWEKVQGKTRIRESFATLKTGSPSIEVINRIIEMSNYTKNKDRLRRYRNGMLAVFMFLLLGSGVAAGFGFKFARDAESSSNKAAEAEKQADERIRNADEKAAMAEVRADKKIKQADKKRQAAEKERRIAENKTRGAESLRHSAEIEARRQQGIAKSREKASEAAQLRRGGADNIIKSIQTAKESVLQAREVGAATTESNMALRASLAMLPTLHVWRPLQGSPTAAFSPDAQTVAVVNSTGTLQLLQTENLKDKDSAQPTLVPLEGNKLFAVSDGGKFLATADSNHVRVFNPRSGELLCEFEVKNQNLVDWPGSSEGEDVIQGLALSPDGRYVAVAANHKTGDEIDAPDETRDFQGAVTLWHVDVTVETKRANRIAILGDNFNKLKDIAFGPGGNVLAVGGKGGAILWNLRNVKARQAEGARKSRNNADGEGEPFAEGSVPQLGKSTNEYEGATEIAFEFERVWVPQDNDVTNIAPGDDMLRFASAAVDKVTVWRRAFIGGYEPSAYLPLAQSVGKLALDSEGQALSVVGTGDEPGKGSFYELWDVNGYTSAESITSRDSFTAVSFTDEDALLAVQADGWKEEVYVTLRPSAKEDASNRFSLQEPTEIVRRSTGGGNVIDSRGEMNVYCELGGGRFLIASQGEAIYVRHVLKNKTFPLPSYLAHDFYLGGRLQISDDGSLVAELPATSIDTYVRLFKLEQGAYVPRGLITNYMNSGNYSTGSLIMSSDGSLLAYINTAGALSLRFVNDRSHTPVHFDVQNVSGLLFSKSGLYLAATSDQNTLIVFRTADGARLGRILHNGNIEDVAFSEDGRFVATAGNSLDANVLNIASGEVQTFSHTNPVSKVVFSPQADSLATISSTREESVITLFSLKSRAETARLFQGEDVKLLAFSRDGRYLVAAGSIVKQAKKETLYRAMVWNVRTDDLVREAEKRLRCFTGRGAAVCV